MNGKRKKLLSFGTVYDNICYVLEAFKDIGKLSPEQLKKGQYLNPNEKDNFTLVDGRVFHQAIGKIKQNDIARGNQGLPSKGLKTLSVYGPAEYNKMKCYLGKNNSSGYCIAHKDELVSVFSSQKASGDAIMLDAVKNGARRLDCYAFRREGKIEGPLYKLYTKYGFKVDTSMNSGKKGEPYAIVKGVSDYVNDSGGVEPDNPQVVIFMKR